MMHHGKLHCLGQSMVRHYLLKSEILDILCKTGFFSYWNGVSDSICLGSCTYACNTLLLNRTFACRISYTFQLYPKYLNTPDQFLRKSFPYPHPLQHWVGLPSEILKIHQSNLSSQSGVHAPCEHLNRAWTWC